MMMKKLFPAILICVLSLGALAAQEGGIPDLKDELIVSNEMIHRELAALDAEQGYYYMADAQTMADARALEKHRQDLLDEVFELAGVKRTVSTGTGADSPSSRGIIGDVDLADLSPEDFRKVLKAAADKGYKVSYRAGSATIEELDSTVFFKKSAKDRFSVEITKDPEYLGSVRFTEDGKMVIDNDYLHVADNIKKTHGTLSTSGMDLGRDELQVMTKATQRIMATNGEAPVDFAAVKAKIEAKIASSPTASLDLDFKEQLTLMKAGYSPEAAGVVRPGASPEEAAAAKEAFRDKCRLEVSKAWERAKAGQAAKDADLVAAYQRALDAGDASAAEAAKGKLLELRANAYKTTSGALANGGVESMAELTRMGISKEIGPGGETLFKMPGKSGYMTESEVRVQILDAEAKKLKEVRQMKAAPQSKVLRYGGAFLVAANAYQSLTRAGEDVVADMEGDESTAYLLTKQMALAGLYASGVYDTVKTVTDAWDESGRTYQLDKAEGKDPSALWALVRGTSKGVYRIAYDNTIGGGLAALTTTWTAIKEGTGLVSDVLDQRSAEEEAALIETRLKGFKEEMAQRTARSRELFDGLVDEYRSENFKRLSDELAELRSGQPLKDFDADRAFDSFLSTYLGEYQEKVNGSYAEYQKLLGDHGKDDPRTMAAFKTYRDMVRSVEGLDGEDAQARRRALKAWGMGQKELLARYRRWAALAGLPPMIAESIMYASTVDMKDKDLWGKLRSLSLSAPLRWENGVLKGEFQSETRFYFDSYNGVKSSVNWTVFIPDNKGGWYITGVNSTREIQGQRDHVSGYLEVDASWKLDLSVDGGNVKDLGGTGYILADSWPPQWQTWVKGIYQNHITFAIPPK